MLGWFFFVLFWVVFFFFLAFFSFFFFLAFPSLLYLGEPGRAGGALPKWPSPHTCARPRSARLRDGCTEGTGSAGGTEERPGVVPFVALLLLQRRPVSGRALLGTSSACPTNGLCRANVLEQTRRQVALLNATAQDLFSLYLKCQGEPFSSESDRLCSPSGIFFPPFHVNRTTERKEVMVAMYKLFAFLNASLGNITRDQEELNPMAKELLNRLHNTTKTTRGLISNLTCLLCKHYNIFQVDVSYGESSKDKSAFKKKQQGCQVLRKYVQVIAQAARVLLPHLSPA